jgi:hypothetical protein
MTITVTVLLRVAGEGDRDFTLKKATVALKATRASSPCMHGLAEMEHFFLKELEQQYLAQLTCDRSS